MSNNYNTNSKTGRPKNPRDFVRISTHIPKEHYLIISAISEEEDLSKSQLFRRAIELYLVSQSDVLGINTSDFAMATHLSESRTKQAISRNFKASHHSDLDNPALDIFQQLNPEAF